MRYRKDLEMNIYFYIWLVVLGFIFSGCGSEPEATLKQSSSSASAERSDTADTEGVQTTTQDDEDDSSDQLASEDSNDEETNEPRAFTGELANAELRYLVQVDVIRNKVFLTLDVFDSETEQNIEFDELPRVSHVDASGCCQPTPPRVVELEAGRIQTSPLDIRHAGIQRIGFAVLVDGLEHIIIYEYDAA